MWEQLRLHLPTPATELRAQRDRLRLLRISVAAVVRGYNQVRPCWRGPVLAVGALSSPAQQCAMQAMTASSTRPCQPLAADSQLCDSCSSWAGLIRRSAACSMTASASLTEVCCLRLTR